MRTLIFTLSVILFIACNQTTENGLTSEEEKVLVAKINEFTYDKYYDFKSDSIRERGNYEIELIRTTDLPRTKISEFAQTHIESWVVNTYNKPYKIEKDFKLNLKSYLSYCKAMNLDSKTYIDILLK